MEQAIGLLKAALVKGETSISQVLDRLGIEILEESPNVILRSQFYDFGSQGEQVKKLLSLGYHKALERTIEGFLSTVPKPPTKTNSVLVIPRGLLSLGIQFHLMRFTSKDLDPEKMMNMLHDIAKDENPSYPYWCYDIKIFDQAEPFNSFFPTNLEKIRGKLYKEKRRMLTIEEGLALIRENFLWQKHSYAFLVNDCYVGRRFFGICSIEGNKIDMYTNDCGLKMPTIYTCPVDVV